MRLVCSTYIHSENSTDEQEVNTKPLCILREAIPLCEQNILRKICWNKTKGDLLLHKATSFDPYMGSTSGQQLNNN
jgi:hypothetical protein